MKKIVILGSKPGAEFPTADICYAANDSLFEYSEEIRKYKEICSVYSAGVFLDRYGEDGSLFLSTLEAHSALRISKIMFWRYKTDHSFFSRAAEFSLIEQDPVYLDPRNSNNCLKSLAGLQEPILSAATLFSAFLNVGTMPLLKALSSKLRSNPTDAPSSFRVSTGVATLCLAIAENGVACDYFVTGIGASDRSKHRTRDVRSDFSSTGDNHVLPDLALIRRVTQITNLTFSDPDLARRFI